MVTTDMYMTATNSQTINHKDTCEECNYRSYAPPPITGKDSLLAFPSKLKALLVLVVVHTVEVVPDKGFK